MEAIITKYALGIGSCRRLSPIERQYRYNFHLSVHEKSPNKKKSGLIKE
jgi:hypothetical protein